MSENNALQTYEIETSFTFTGVFKVQAKNEQEARDLIENHCGLVIGGEIHSSLPEETVDWDFDTHPLKETLELMN